MKIVASFRIVSYEQLVRLVEQVPVLAFSPFQEKL
jgi:hypothetical protein